MQERAKYHIIPAKIYVSLVVIMFTIGAFSGFIKVVFGSIAILSADILLILLALILKPVAEKNNLLHVRRDPPLVALYCISALLFGIGFCQSFNTNLPSISKGLFYFRISSYPFLAVFIGFKMLRIPGSSFNLYRIILYLIAPINALYAVLQLIYLDPLGTRLVKHLGWGEFGSLGTFRVTGFLQGPVQLGLLCAIASSYFFLMMTTSSKRRVLHAVLFFLLFAGLIVSMGRASMLGFALFVIFGFFLLFRWKRRIKVLTILLAVFVAGLFLVHRADREVVTTLSGRIRTLVNLKRDLSFQEGRLANWRGNILPAVASSPLGRGNGSTGTFGRTGNEMASYEQPVLQTESLYFSIGIELGWVALLLYLLFCFVVIRSSIGLIYAKPSAFAFAGTAILIIFSTAGITSPNMSAFPVTWLFFLTAPIVVALFQHNARFRFSSPRSSPIPKGVSA